MSSWTKMALFVLVTALLTRLLPFSEFFRNVYTLVHEMAHAVTTLLLSGSVLYIHLYADQSGVTHSLIQAGWRSIPIAIAGYVGAALFAWLLFRLQAAGRVKTGLVIVAAIAAAGLLLFVRNTYGMLWCAGFAGLTLLVCFLAPGWLRKFYYSLVAFICLVESVFSAITILAIAVIDPAAAGDAASLSRATPLPAAAWGAFFTLFALWCAKNSTALLFRSIWHRRTRDDRRSERLPC